MKAFGMTLLFVALVVNLVPAQPSGRQQDWLKMLDKLESIAQHDARFWTLAIIEERARVKGQPLDWNLGMTEKEFIRLNQIRAELQNLKRQHQR